VVFCNGASYLLAKRPFALCRCGGSQNKPFCDGTHSRIGFAAAEAAVPASQDKPAQ
jgi:CDGSH-type Zn-finger protein